MNCTRNRFQIVWVGTERFVLGILTLLKTLIQNQSVTCESLIPTQTAPHQWYAAVYDGVRTRLQVQIKESRLQGHE